MIDGAYDHRLLHYLQNHIRQLPLADQYILRSTLYCGSKVARLPQLHEGVFLLSNGEDSRLFGLNTCKNAWYCPTCSMKIMSKYAANIACLIDAMEEKNQWAFMLTLTVPHTILMSCEEVLKILYDTWKAFIARGNKNQTVSWRGNKEKKYKHGQEKVRKFGKSKTRDVFASFCEQFNCVHRVRVGEFTCGKNGWHPHFHCLFFVDADKFKQVKDWQKIFEDRWTELVKRNILKVWNKRYPNNEKNNKARMELMYERADTTTSKSAFISVDKDGEVIRQRSSNYICGWGADRELTGNVKNKASAPGHMTPYQLLEKAANTGEERYWNWYLEYMLAIRKYANRRVNFSKGAKQIIAKWKQTQKYVEYMKKKRIQENRRKWELVCWFTSQQWSKICSLNESSPIISNLLFLAKFCDRELIAYFLNLYDIKLVETEHPAKDFIEKLYNDELSEEYTGETQEESQVA